MNENLSSDPADSTSKLLGSGVLSDGVSRRNAIKYGSIGAGMLVAAPTILTLGASPASASGTVYGEDYEGATGSTGTSKNLGLTINADNAAGMYVAVFAIAENLTGTNAATFTTPAGWTKIGAKGTASQVFGSAISCAVFVAESADNGDGTFTAPSINATYTGGRPNNGTGTGGSVGNTVSRPRVLAITQFRMGSKANSSTAAAFGNIVTTAAQATGDATAVVSNSSLFLANVRLAGADPSVTFPGGISSNTGTYQDGGTAQTKIAVSTAYDFPSGGYASGATGAKTITLGAAGSLGVSVSVAIG
jgi:hypothetical protein